MTDIVAVVSVITSGAVGIGGVLVTGYGAWAERRWQRREERAIEVRTVLDDAAFPIGTELRSLSAAVQFIQNASADPSAAAQGELLDKARAQIDDVSDAAKQSWTVQSRLGLRLGLDSAVVRLSPKPLSRLRASTRVCWVSSTIPGPRACRNCGTAPARPRSAATTLHRVSFEADEAPAVDGRIERR